MGLLGHAASPNEEMLTDLQLWAISQLASVWLVDAEPYEPCRVAGVVSRWRVDPRKQQVEAVLYDGTAELLVRWTDGTSPVQTHGPATRGLVLEGIPTIDLDGAIVMLDPTFTRVPYPDIS